MNEVTFLTSISNHMYYRAVRSMDNMKAASLDIGLEDIIRYYALREFSIVVILVDIQFKCLKDRKK